MRILLKNEKAFSLVEAVVALAIVGVAMVIITQVSLKTLKQAKKNELQEVAVQSAVEAMDFAKQPNDLEVDVPPATSKFYKLDIANAQLISTGVTQSEINSCSAGSEYIVAYLNSSGYTVCQQIYITKPGTSSEKWDIEVKVVWLSVDGEYEESKIKGYRLGGLK
ncbi:type II secretion system GspH family protein [Patescibacteria group bacterium]|nr:type II secretion system GspH family protein [Patescibacteria group bacterium]